MRRLYVLYDARCGLCRWARQWLDGQEKLVDLEFRRGRLPGRDPAVPTVDRRRPGPRSWSWSATPAASTGAGTPGSCASTPWKTTGSGPSGWPPPRSCRSPARGSRCSRSSAAGSRDGWAWPARPRSSRPWARVAAPACEVDVPDPPTSDGFQAGRISTRARINREPWSARVSFFAEQLQRDVEGLVPPAVGEGAAGGVLDEDGRPLRDPVDPADPGDPVVVEAHEVARADRVGLGGDLAGGNQVVDRGRVAEDLLAAIRRNGSALHSSTGPLGQELGEVEQLVLEDPLERLQPVPADQARDGDRAVDVAEGLEQQQGRDRRSRIRAGRRPAAAAP